MGYLAYVAGRAVGRLWWRNQYPLVLVRQFVGGVHSHVALSAQRRLIRTADEHSCVLLADAALNAHREYLEMEVEFGSAARECLRGRA